MMILSIDLETTGLDVETCEIIEFGAALYDTESKQVVKTWSAIAYKTEEPLPQEVQDVTGITPEIMKRFGDSIWPTVYQAFDNEIHAIAAHNGAFFDRPVLERFIPNKCNSSEYNFKTPWIDTMVDIDFGNIKTRKLTYILAELGILQPYKHRALFDALAVVSLLNHYAEQVEALDLSQDVTLFVDPKKESADYWKEHGGRWNSEINAMTVAGRFNPPAWKGVNEYKESCILYVSEASYDERDQVKARGFRWCEERKVSYIWEPPNKYSFKTVQVESWEEYDEGLFIAVANARPFIDNNLVKEAGFKFFGPAKKWIKTVHVESQVDFDFPIGFFASEEGLEEVVIGDAIRKKVDDDEICPDGGLWFGSSMVSEFGSETVDLFVVGFGASFEEPPYAPNLESKVYRFAYLKESNEGEEG